MPVTARLSRKFYETFGDDIANELVDWFNQVDLTDRTDLERINELNFARFDAKVEQRFAEFELRWEKRFAELDARLDRRISSLETRLIRWVVALWLATALGVLALQRL
jgi:hypothetical protein